MEEFSPYTNIEPISPYPCKKWMPVKVDFDTGEVEWGYNKWTEEDEKRLQETLSNITYATYADEGRKK